MNEEIFNISVRKFLKKVGITAQREIEQAVRSAIVSGRIKPGEAVPAKATLVLDGVGLTLAIEGLIELE